MGRCAHPPPTSPAPFIGLLPASRARRSYLAPVPAPWSVRRGTSSLHSRTVAMSTNLGFSYALLLPGARHACRRHARRRTRAPRLLGGLRQPRREAGRIPARRPRRRDDAAAPAVLRPRRVPDRAVRP